MAIECKLSFRDFYWHLIYIYHSRITTMQPKMVTCLGNKERELGIYLEIEILHFLAFSPGFFSIDFSFLWQN